MGSRSDDDMEIIPPTRSTLPARRSNSTELAAAQANVSRLVNPGGVVSSALTRMEARRHARTYDALTTRTNSETSLVEADTTLGHSLMRNARMRHEYAELPRMLATDRAKREIGRIEEVRDAYHRLEMADARRLNEQAQADAALTETRTGLTVARQRLTMARKGLLNAEQELEAQRQHGGRYHALDWQHKTGERELYVEEQQAILNEHRKKVAHSAEQCASEEELLEQRAQMNADGLDTGAVDLAIERGKARSRK